MIPQNIKDKLLDDVEKAHREICDLASGKRKWEMCIPPQPTDSDMTLQKPLDHIEKLIKIVEIQGDALIKIEYGKFPPLHNVSHELIAEQAITQVAELLKELESLK